MNPEKLLARVPELIMFIANNSEVNRYEINVAVGISNFNLSKYV